MSVRLTRRRALKFAGAYILGVLGCRKLSSLPTGDGVLVAVPWKTVDKFDSVVVNAAGKIVIVAVVSGVQQTHEISISKDDLAKLSRGSKLYIELNRSVRYTVPYTLEAT